MSGIERRYSVEVTWTGNSGVGTRDYRSYERAHRIAMEGRPSILASSDPAFRGDPTRHTPEELLVASLSACHMLWYLHLCADHGVVVTAYQDAATGLLEVTSEGAGRFTEVVLRPMVTIAPGSDASVANEMHARAHDFCFIAGSVNFPVQCEPGVRVADEG